MVTISQIKETVGQIAPKYDVADVKLFGSYAKGNPHPESDIDLLVRYQENPVSVFKIFGFQEEVSSVLGAEVDILKSPLENIIYPNFDIGVTVDVYGD